MDLESAAEPPESSVTTETVQNETPTTAVVLNHCDHNNSFSTAQPVQVMEQPVSVITKKDPPASAAIDTTGMDPTPLFMKFRIGFAATGVFVGLSILICFQADPNLTNIHIALWGLASGRWILLCLHL